MKALFTLFVLAIAALSPASAWSQQTCGEAQSPVPHKFCITKTEGSQSTDILFYLHGGGGDAQEGKRIVDLLKNEWEENDRPILISLSFGPFWLLTKKNPGPQSGLLEVVRDAILPQLEKRALDASATRRMILGYSMGAFNSAQLLMHSPRAHFAKAALVCPGMIDISPWASEQEVNEHATKLGVPAGALKSLAGRVKAFVSSESFYLSEVDPIGLAPSRIKGKADILVAVNENDPMYRDGGQKFAEAVKAPNGFSFQTWSGAHCATDVKRLAEFLK